MSLLPPLLPVAFAPLFRRTLLGFPQRDVCGWYGALLGWLIFMAIKLLGALHMHWYDRVSIASETQSYNKDFSLCAGLMM